MIIENAYNVFDVLHVNCKCDFVVSHSIQSIYQLLNITILSIDSKQAFNSSD